MIARPHPAPTRYPWSDADTAERICLDTCRWLEKAVIGLNLCPFAKSVYVKKQVRFALTASTTPDALLEELSTEFERLIATPARELDTTLLIHPAVLTDFLDYHFFLQEADALIDRSGWRGIFQIASLHPHYEFAGSDTEDIENYSNRSPYPTLHLLREDSIDRAVAAYPDPEAIYERNMDTLRTLGHAGWADLLKQE